MATGANGPAGVGVMAMIGDAKPTILVCGGGSIGQRHIRNLKTLGANVTAWRQRGALAERLAQEFAIEVHTDLAAAIDRCDAVVVATATDRHTPIALAAAAAGKHLFIEKPLADSLADVGELRRTTRGLVVEIGCMLRASPTLAKLRAALRSREFGLPMTFRGVMGFRLDHWRPGSDCQASYSAHEARGGGALMDLIHQIDLVQYLFGPIAKVYCRLSRVGALAIDANDLATLVVEVGNGVVGQLQMDMISPAYRGEVEVVTSDAVWHWDFQSNELQLRQGNSVSLSAKMPDGFDRNDLFLGHMAHFLRRVAGVELPPICSLEDGISALEVAIAAYASDRSRQEIEIRRA